MVILEALLSITDCQLSAIAASSRIGFSSIDWRRIAYFSSAPAATAIFSNLVGAPPAASYSPLARPQIKEESSFQGG
jgi:hypothetical protein